MLRISDPVLGVGGGSIRKGRKKPSYTKWVRGYELVTKPIITTTFTVTFCTTFTVTFCTPFTIAFTTAFTVTMTPSPELKRRDESRFPLRVQERLDNVPMWKVHVGPSQLSVELSSCQLMISAIAPRPIAFMSTLSPDGTPNVSGSDEGSYLLGCRGDG